MDKETERFLAMIQMQGEGELSVEDSYWYPEFGNAVANQCCVFRLELIELPVKTGFVIDWTQSDLPFLASRIRC